MISLILDGSDKNDRCAREVHRHLQQVLESCNSSVTAIILGDRDIKSCIGCLNCFFSTPGVCIFNDIVREIPHLYIDSTAVFLITPVTFGGFSSTLAKTFYRLAIQLELHLVVSSKGEVNRKKRYKQPYPSLVVIGIEKYRSPANREVFTELTASIAFRHIKAPVYKVLFFTGENSGEEIREKLQQTITHIRSIG